MSFLRAYKLEFQPKAGKNVLLFQDASTIGLCIEFRVEKKSSGTPNVSTVTIYNPSNETIASFQSTGVLSLEAGYSGDIGGILFGLVQTANVSHDGINVKLELGILEQDPQPPQADKKFPLYTTNLQVANYLTQLLTDRDKSIKGVNPYILTQLVTYNTPQVVYGDPYARLGEILSAIGMIFIVDKGVLSIVDKNKSLLDSPIAISATSGMIGSPKQINEVAAGGILRTGIEFSTILNHNISLKRQIMITSRAVSGLYTIDSFSIEGNSFDGDWKNDVRCLNAPVI